MVTNMLNRAVRNKMVKAVTAKVSEQDGGNRERYGSTDHVIKVILTHNILPAFRELQCQIPVFWKYNCPEQLHLSLQFNNRKSYKN